MTDAVRSQVEEVAVAGNAALAGIEAEVGAAHSQAAAVGTAAGTVAVRAVPTRFGAVTVEASARGVVRVWLPGEARAGVAVRDAGAGSGVAVQDAGAEDAGAESNAGVQDAAARQGAAVHGGGAAQDAAAESIAQRAASQLEQYFAGERASFTVPLDWARASSGFTGEVQRALARIPYGGTITYGDLAAQLGHAGAARAVGTACATNPLPIFAACHRVVRAGGSAGRYGGGEHMKRWMLDHEAAHRD